MACPVVGSVDTPCGTVCAVLCLSCPVLCADRVLVSLHGLTLALPTLAPRRYSDPAQWIAFLGLHDQSKRSAPGVQEHRLKRIIVHPSFNDFTFDYDLALLELEKPAEYSTTVRPICLPDTSHVFPAGKAIWVTGWGHTEEGGECRPRPQCLALNLRTEPPCIQPLAGPASPAQSWYWGGVTGVWPL